MFKKGEIVIDSDGDKGKVYEDQCHPIYVGVIYKQINQSVTLMVNASKLKYHPDQKNKIILKRAWNYT